METESKISSDEIHGALKISWKFYYHVQKNQNIELLLSKCQAKRVCIYKENNVLADWLATDVTTENCNITFQHLLFLLTFRDFVLTDLPQLLRIRYQNQNKIKNIKKLALSVLYLLPRFRIRNKHSSL